MMKIIGDNLVFTALLTTTSKSEYDRLEMIDPVSKEWVDYDRECTETKWANYPKEYEDTDLVHDVWVHGEAFIKLPLTHGFELPHGVCRISSDYQSFYCRGNLIDVIKFIGENWKKGER
jgi:hypothetical protein